MTPPPEVVLLPGTLCDHRLWHGDERRILRCLQNRGLNTVEADVFADDTMVAMAQRALAQTSGLIIPLGFSMGAIVALEMARLAPERISALVLTGVNAAADLPERAAVRPAQEAEALQGGLERIVVEQLLPNYLAMSNRDNPQIRALVLDMAKGLGADVFVRQSRALRTRRDNRPTLAQLRKPVFLACGAEDALCPPAWHRQWQAMAPNAVVHVVRSAGHLLPLEQPDALARQLDAWLEAKL